jgi:hypothetical protein
VGWFSSKPKAPKAPAVKEMQVISLRQGTQIPLVDVDPEFVEQARVTFPKKPKMGHYVPVHVGLESGEIVARYQGKVIGRMDPKMKDLYIGEFETLNKMNRVGRTNVIVKPEEFKTPHALSLNYGVRAIVDGGIIP